MSLPAISDQWYVTNGVVAFGPLDFSRLSEQRAHGRVPGDSYVRHESWRVWRRLDEVEALGSGDREALVHRLRDISAASDERASDPGSLSLPPPPASGAAPAERPESRPPLSSARPAVVDPVGVLGRAATIEEALMLALSTAAAAVKADVGLLHRYRRDLDAVVTTYAHGSEAEALLGERLAPDDPSVTVARAGRTVIAEPAPGQAGRYVAGRLHRCADRLEGIALVPVIVFGELLAMIEVGRQEPPFAAREVARVEDIVDALNGRIVVSGWLP